ncbi:hypothetical protein TX24_17245 [Pseudomonas lactis]|nr:hypothetical protein TX24_17245 [Pseudomonas lactis]
MVAHAVVDHTPNHKLVAFHYVPGGIFRIFSHQNHLAISTVQTLAHALGIERRNNDISMTGCFASVNDHQVTAENTDTLHTVALDLSQVNVWCTDFKKLIQRNQLFQMISRRRGKSSRDRIGVHRQGMATAGDGTKKGRAHKLGLNSYCMDRQLTAYSLRRQFEPTKCHL